MDWLIGAGTVLTLAGLGLLVWCILQVTRAKRAGLDDEALRIRLQHLIPVNLGALMLSVFGLILVVVGIVLK